MLSDPVDCSSSPSELDSKPTYTLPLPRQSSVLLSRGHVRENAASSLRFRSKTDPLLPSTPEPASSEAEPAAKTCPTETFATKTNCIFDTPTLQQTVNPSIVGGIGRQSVGENVGMTKAHIERKEKLREIFNFLTCDTARDQQRVEEHCSVPDLPPERIVFSEEPPNRDTMSENTLSSNSSAALASMASRKTPYPSPVLLGELILQQTKEEADGNYDEDSADAKGRKTVRLMGSPQSASSTETASRASPPVASAHSSHESGRKLRRVLKRLFSKRKNVQSKEHLSLTDTSPSLPLTPIRADIAPTLPGGGRQEITVSKELPSLITTGSGLERDFLPSEATFVPTPISTPIIGGPITFGEALANMPSLSSSKVERQRSLVINEQEASPTVILTRPLLTQEIRQVAPFIKMGESFPAPLTPPLTKKRKDTKIPNAIEKLPKLNTHGLLGKDEGNSFNTRRKHEKRISITSLKAFFVKPFQRRERRHLVATVSLERDKEIAGVGLRSIKSVQREPNYTANYSWWDGIRSLASSPLPRSTSVIEERNVWYKRPGIVKAPLAHAATKENAQEKDIKGTTEDMKRKGVAGKKYSVRAEEDFVSEIADADTSTVSPVYRHGTPPLQVIYPLLFSPPASPIERPASTILTTMTHEKWSEKESAALFSGNGLRDQPIIIPLPLLPQRETTDHPNSEASNSHAGRSITDPEHLSRPSSLIIAQSRDSLRRLKSKPSQGGIITKPNIYLSSPEEIIQPPPSPPPTRACSRSTNSNSKPGAKSRSSSLSWESGKTVLDTGDLLVNNPKTALSTGETEERRTEVAAGNEQEDEVGRKGHVETGVIESMIGEEIQRWEGVGKEEQACRL